MTFKPPFLYTPYNHDTNIDRPSFNNCNDEKVTIDSMADDADINVIMKRFGLTGIMPENVRTPTYGDFDGIRDYRSALHAVMNANEAFMEIPAEIRAKFSNDPQTFLEWIENPSNLDEARKLGLAKPLQAPITPPPATGVAAPPPGGATGQGNTVPPSPPTIK